MKQRVLISGAGFAGLTLAFWLDRFGYDVTIVEIAKELRKGGSPIDLRGEALQVAKDMGIWDRVKANEFLHSDEIVDAQDQTIVRFSLNAQPEYQGDIEIHRGDLLDILYNSLPKDSVKIAFGHSIKSLQERENAVEVTFENGSAESFDYVFGADGIHSIARRMLFGEEKQFSKFFGAYFAFAETKRIDTGRPKDVGVSYRMVGRQVLLYPFKDATNAIMLFRSPHLAWDYRNREQHKQILFDTFKNHQEWKIPEILDEMLSSENLFFDEVSQIHLPVWYKGRAALIGDAAHAPAFFTGMGTSLAMIGAARLARSLAEYPDYRTAFEKYQELHKPFAQEIQSCIVQGQKYQLPESEEDLKASIDRFRQIETTA